MNLIKTQNQDRLTLSLEGRLDTTTAPKLEAQINALEPQITQLVLELGKLEYVSSAGLRVLLSAQKLMNQKNGSMLVKNAQDAVLEVFEITGFSEILTLENG